MWVFVTHTGCHRRQHVLQVCGSCGAWTLCISTQMCKATPGVGKLFHQGSLWLQVLVPTYPDHTDWPISCLKTRLSWLNEPSQQKPASMWFHRGLNPGPSAHKAGVLAALWNHYVAITADLLQQAVQRWGAKCIVIVGIGTQDLLHLLTFFPFSDVHCVPV